MASFVHLADEKDGKLIEKNGIKSIKMNGRRRGVYCTPVVKDFSITHQWSRELKRRGMKSLICVQFRVSDDEMVKVGKYNGDKISMTAAESVKAVSDHVDPMGLEVVFNRKILPKEIKRIYSAPRIVGWRFHPDAKGKMPFCFCQYSNRGGIRAQSLISRGADRKTSRVTTRRKRLINQTVD
jgi:hypothetical protein